MTERRKLARLSMRTISNLSTNTAQLTRHSFQAHDNDTGAFADLRFSISDSVFGSGQASYFSIDPVSGLVTTRKSFEAVSRQTLPFRLEVTVRDNPNDSENSKMQKTQLVVCWAFSA